MTTSRGSKWPKGCHQNPVTGACWSNGALGFALVLTFAVFLCWCTWDFLRATTKKDTPSRQNFKFVIFSLFEIWPTNPFCQLLGIYIIYICIYIHPKKSSKGIQPCIFASLPAHRFFRKPPPSLPITNLYSLQSFENWTDTRYYLGGGFKYFSFSTLFGEDSHFD